jgi:hypothetical protein
MESLLVIDGEDSPSRDECIVMRGMCHRHRGDRLIPTVVALTALNPTMQAVTAALEILDPDDPAKRLQSLLDGRARFRPAEPRADTFGPTRTGVFGATPR